MLAPDEGKGIDEVDTEVMVGILAEMRGEIEHLEYLLSLVERVISEAEA